ncbi:MAG TPA: GC-type dockerin domain-anchored protein [Phycisphaerales bacterium]|nr:GC-type dockerin domain-anchored protein [Phycisphaerales bacterium]
MNSKLATVVVGLATLCTRAASQYEWSALEPKEGGAFEFGASVALDGDFAVVGAPRSSLGGGAFVFDIADPRTPFQIAKLVKDDNNAGDRLGASVAIAGGIVLAGAPSRDEGGFGDTGSAYLFSVATGDQLSKLLPEQISGGTFYGSSVATDGRIAVIGALRPGGGAVYVYDIADPATPAKVSQLSAGAESRFGAFLALDGDLLLVGAPGSGLSSAGEALLFDVSDPSNPIQLHRLLPPHSALHFGISVDLRAGRAIIGASSDEGQGDSPGGAFIFDVTSGDMLVELALPPDASPLDYFGTTVALNERVAYVGAPGDDRNLAQCGAFYSFDLATGNLRRKFLASRCPSNGDRFSRSLALRGGVAVVGAPADPAAYLFNACAPDVSNDGTVDYVDFVSFLIAWSNHELVAEWDGNGLIDSRDLIAFLNEWVAGC